VYVAVDQSGHSHQDVAPQFVCSTATATTHTPPRTTYFRIYQPRARSRLRRRVDSL